MKSLIAFLLTVTAAVAKPPNILLVITDDQGFGDLGVHGNPVVRTPSLDAFAKQSVWLKNFYVCPVCSPTRASLMTGQYHYRTGVVDTAFGRSMMRPDVTTLPEVLAKKGYRTGLFGKWHLGDNYPMRPEDRGFQSTFWLRGGGLAQPGDPPGTEPATAYFDSPFVKNGKNVKAKGYCSDAITDAALEFLNAGGEQPFFAYVAFNAPHAPLQIAEQFWKPYRERDLSPKAFPAMGQPVAAMNPDLIAKTYAMVENIDTNFARMLKVLEDRKIAKDTIVIFLTDNGPDYSRFNSGLRGRKTTVYDGGLRVPCYLRYGSHWEAGRAVTMPTMHIDLAPTLDAASGTPLLNGCDGCNLRAYFAGAPQKPLERTLFQQWHRGDVPELNRAFMARDARYKLVQANGAGENAKWTPKFELFDLSTDEYEQHDLIEKLPDVATRLKSEYAKWFKDVTAKGFAVPPIVLGNAKENPAILSRQNWRGLWNADTIGTWHVRIERPGTYEIKLLSKQKFRNVNWKYESPGNPNAMTMTTQPGDEKLEEKLTLVLQAGDFKWTPTLKNGDKSFGPSHLVVERK